MGQGKIIGFVAAGVVLIVLVVIASRGCGTTLGAGTIVIHDNSEYVEASKEAMILSQDPLKQLDQLHTLETTEKENLIKALTLYQGMLNYLPTNPLPRFPMGEIYEALGDHKKAIQSLQAYLDATTRGTSNEAKVTRADAHYMISQAAVLSQNYKLALEEANAALKAFPGTASYLVARASAYTQLGKKQEALDDLSEALSKEPDNRRAQYLYKLLNR